MKYFRKFSLVVFSTIVFVCWIIRCSGKVSTEPETTVFTWPQSTAEKQGIDGTKVFLANAEAVRRGFINSVILIKNGYLVREWYYNGLAKGQPQNIYGASTCLISALVGIAVRENKIHSLDQKLIDGFQKISRIDWLGDITVTSCIFSLFFIPLHGIGSKGYNWQIF